MLPRPLRIDKTNACSLKANRTAANDVNEVLCITYLFLFRLRRAFITYYGT